MASFSNEVVDLVDGLEDGWIPGRKLDLYDSQWSSFRGSLLVLIGFGTFHSACSIWARKKSELLHNWTQMVLGLAFVFVLHGYHAIYVLSLVSVNFGLTRIFAGRWLVSAVWIFNLGALVLVSGTGEMWEIESLSW